MDISAEITPTGFTEHYISDGVYARVFHIRAGDIVMGAKHLTTHMNILLNGKCYISIDGDIRRMKAPYFFEALKNSRKTAYAITDMQIVNIIPTDKTSVEEIENEVVDYTLPDCVEDLLKPLKLLKGV